MTTVGEISQIGVAIGAGFFVGILIGYALKKVVKVVAVVAVVVGLFFAGLAYLQYQPTLTSQPLCSLECSQSCQDYLVFSPLSAKAADL